MPVKAFHNDKEVDLSSPSKKKAPRQLLPFELGFHESVINKQLSENPYPPNSEAEAEWISGWETYKKRKEGLRWFDPKINGSGATDEIAGFTYLCLVLDEDGFYLHMLCKTRGLTLSGYTHWETYNYPARIKVIEYTAIQRKNPHLINAMQAQPKWKALLSKKNIQPHAGTVQNSLTFDDAYSLVQGKNYEFPINGSQVSTFSAEGTIGQEGEHLGERVIIFRSNGIERARSYECCWGHLTNCSRTSIDFYTKAVNA